MANRAIRHLATALAWGLAVAMLAGPAAADPNDVAIIISNKDYQRGVRPVDFALRDGEAFKRIATTIFQVPERNVIELPNAGFGRLVELFGHQGQGSAELNRLIRAKDAKIYVFYSGHGMTLSDGGAEPFHVLLPVDSHPDSALATGYRRAWIEKALGEAQRARAPDGHVFLFMDACFSGGSGGGDLVRDTSMVGNNAAAVKEKAVDRILVVAASGPREVAYWDTQRKRGVYTDALLFGLFGAADDPAHGGNGDGRVTGVELERFLLVRMDQRLAAISPAGPRRQQTPGILGQKSMVLATLPKSLPAADEVLAHEERTQCRLLAAQPEAKQIRAFLGGCVTCTPQCKGGLSARLVALERSEAACTSERLLFAPLRCPGDHKRIADLATNAECPSVKADAVAFLDNCDSQIASDRAKAAARKRADEAAGEEQRKAQLAKQKAEMDAHHDAENARLNEIELKRLELLARKKADEEADAARLALEKVKLDEIQRQQLAALAAQNEKLALELQAELRRVGCYIGKDRDEWGPEHSRALAEFARVAKLSISTSAPSAPALLAVSAARGRVCPLVCGKAETEIEGRCVPRGKAPPASKLPKAANPSPPDAKVHRRLEGRAKGVGGGQRCWRYDQCVEKCKETVRFPRTWQQCVSLHPCSKYPRTC